MSEPAGLESTLRGTLASLHTKLEECRSLEEEASLVKAIADCHEELARFLFRKSRVTRDVEDYVQQIRKDFGDYCLDLAIVSKRAQKRRLSANAHALRMTICPDTIEADGIRLLGLADDGDDVPNHGIFETRVRCDDVCNASSAMEPTVKAREIGFRLRRLLKENCYLNEPCRTYLKPLVPTTERLFDGSSFTSRRWEIPSLSESSYFGLDILVRLFLFGLAVPESIVKECLGKETLDFLMHQAHLLVPHAVSPEFIVSEVQIYPLSAQDLHLADTVGCDCFFLTDWPVESLRSTKHAVMSVGYDTLELLSLASPTRGSVLDMCCGCGIQGIWTATLFSCSSITLSDVNPRACRLASANVALNGVQHAMIVQGNLYQSLPQNVNYAKILANPPFVASTLESSSPLFAHGGGTEGMQFLQRLVNQAPLEDTGTMLLVTELPNIEDAIELLQSYCAEPTSVRIAYVGKDVETVEEYSRNRLAEMDETKLSDGGWAEQQRQAGIRNRALALVAITNGTGESGLFCYNGDTKKKKNKKTILVQDDDADEFLTQSGIMYTRNQLIKFC